MKKILALVLCAAMVFSLAACAAKPAASAEAKADAPAAEAAASTGAEKLDNGMRKVKKIGLCMPTKEQTIWTMQGNRLTEALEGAGYEVLIEYAEDDSAKQNMQIENMISKGVDMLIIAAVDGAALTDSCEKAHKEGIWVIADDRGIINTDAVDWYVTCDYNRLAEMQGQYIIDKLDLENVDGPFTMEIFAGSQDDTNSLVFYNGQMSKLQPYVDNGKIVIKSGQNGAAECAIQSWDSAKAQARMDNLLSGYYSDEPLDICLSTADCLAIGCISSLESMGYGSPELPFPIVTGQDAELAAIKNIVAGKQTMTVFIDAKLLAERTVELIAALNENKAPTPDGEFDNNNKKVPALYYDPLVIDKNNVDYLIDVGFYTKEEIYG